jgi:hypothetical protein
MRTGAILLLACGWLAGCDESLLDQTVDKIVSAVTGGLVAAH